MDYTGVRLKDTLTIQKLYTIHYYEFSKQYTFRGERHDFWEMVYVDRGEIHACAEEQDYLLKQGEILFHEPNEWHRLYADGETAPNIAVISFACTSPAMSFCRKKRLFAGQEEKRLISRMIAEYQNAFSTPLDNPDTKFLTRRKNALPGAEQMIRICLSNLLLSFLRNAPRPGQKASPYEKYFNSVLGRILGYMSDHLSENITLRDLTEYSGTNRTAIENMFRESFSMGAIEYFSRMKIDAAKKYLREDHYNITQISEILGYSGIHYFSRQFKRFVHMTPTEYALSIKAMMEESDAKFS